jgi:membrane fusion protein (multidrug efflux system)
MSRPVIARIAAVLALAAPIAAGCKKKEEAPAPPPPSVQVAPVVQKDVAIYSEWIGSLNGNVNAEIRPQIEGYVLKRVYNEGALVHEGDTLFEIDPRDFQASYDQAQGNVSQYEATLANAKTTVARYTPLARDKAISQQELDDAETKERTASANLASAKASLERARLNLGWTKVTSPISGIAGVAKSQVGDLVGRTTVMTTVSQVDPIRVYFNVSEQEYLAWVARHGPPEKALKAQTNLEQGPLQLILANGSTYPHRGRGILLGREVDPKTGTIQIAGVFPNPGDILRPGQYGKVRIALDTRKGALLIPQRAVSELQGSLQVAVVGPDNKVTIKVVKSSGTDGNMYVVDDGLKMGDRVVVEGIQRVRSGMTVVPTEASAAPEPAAAAAKTSP